MSGAPRQFIAAGRMIDTGDGLRLRVVSSGEGPPVVLLHGFTGSAETWRELRSALEERHAVYAVELPGHGGSRAPDDPSRYALRRFADDLVKVLDALRVERAAVLGYSLGARAALRFALNYGSRVSGLILESGSPGISDERARSERRESDRALADTIEREGVIAFVDRWERSPLWESQEALPDRVKIALRTQRLLNSAKGLANSLRGAGTGEEPSVLDRLGTLNTPTLVIAGALDAKYVGLGTQLSSAIPNAKLALVEGAGHAVHLEQPQRFSELVAEFLASLR